MTKLCGSTWIDNGWRVAVGMEGPKWVRLVYFKPGGLVGVKRVKGPVPMKPLPGYTAERLARRFWKCGAGRSTSAARKLLAQIK